MAMATTPTALSVASIAGKARACLSSHLPRTIAKTTITTTTFLASKWINSSKMGLNPLQRGCAKKQTIPSRKLLLRASKTELQGLSLGFRGSLCLMLELYKFNTMQKKMSLIKIVGGLPTVRVLDVKPLACQALVDGPDFVMFSCNHCPFAKHLKKDIVKLTNFYMKKGLAVVAISSNSVATHPQAGPELMAEDARILNYPFPYLYDEFIPLKGDTEKNMNAQLQEVF